MFGGWSTRPGSHKLGAKWVEVRIRRDQKESNLKMRSVFETASNTVAAPLNISEVTWLDGTSRSCFFLTNGAAGVGRPSEERGQGSDARGQREP